MRLCYDIEANGLVNNELDKKGNLKPTVDTIHCIVITNVDTGEVHKFTPGQHLQAVQLLKQADVIIGHNIIDYDNRVLEKLCGWAPTCKLIDTLIAGRLMHPDRTNLPKGLKGHSLSNWAQFVGDFKIDYAGGWDAFSQDMLTYCVQDVAANISIYRAQQRWIEANWKLVNFEQKVAAICAEMGNTGFGFNTEAADKLEYEMSARRAELEDTLREVFPTKVHRRFSDKTGKELKSKIEEFNPGSSKQWAERLTEKYGWKPSVTDSGNAVVDEEALKSLSYPEAKLGLEYRDINKKIGMVTDWIKRTIDGRVRGRTNAQGTATGRASHSQPNLAQVPSDARCRALFGPAPDGWVQVGCDLSGIELRCLAHYMAKFDDGAYAKEVVDGDIHTTNQKAAGLPTRNNAKTFIYGFLYSAGPAKIGAIVNGSEAQGKKLISKFLKVLTVLKNIYFLRTPKESQLLIS